MKVYWFLVLLICKQYFAFRYSEKQCADNGSPCRLLTNNELDIASLISKEDPVDDSDKPQYLTNEDHFSYKIKRGPSPSKDDHSFQSGEQRPNSYNFIRLGRNGATKNGFIRFGRNSPDDAESIRFGRRGDQFIRLGKRLTGKGSMMTRNTRVWEAPLMDNLTSSRANRYIRFGRRENSILNSGENALKEELI